MSRASRTRHLRWLQPLRLSLYLMAGVIIGLAATPRPRTGQASERLMPQAPPEAIALVAESLELIDAFYVDPPALDMLVDFAAHGAVHQLDTHSRYMPANEYVQWRGRIHGRLINPGFDVERRPEGILVVALTPASPASRAGLELGDLLVAIDGFALHGVTIAEIRERLLGAAGTAVTLTIRRNGTDRVLDVQREAVRIPAVLATHLNAQVGHVRIRSFQEGVTLELQNAVRHLEKCGTLAALVLDLRDNPGGMLDEAIIMTDLFVPEGVEICSQNRMGEVFKVHLAQQPIAIDLPLVVLVNSRSASASEILAAALQRYQRGHIIGQTTYGKGSVQTTYSLGDGSGLKITTSRYLSATGHEIEEVGIEPDHFLPYEMPADAVLQHALDHLMQEVTRPSRPQAASP